MELDNAAAVVWVFGYGSLIWRADFPYLECQGATIDGYARRFWQGSTDHRGVPGAPGRVLTLVQSPGERCWGRAYRLDVSQQASVLAHLDHREKGGYEKLSLPLRLDSGIWVSGLAYRASPENSEYLGPAPIDEMLAQIASAHGHSGPNAEYVLELDQALQAVGQIDPHVSALAVGLRS